MPSTVTPAADLREVGDEELVSQLTEAKEELFNLRFQVATGQLDNNARLRTVRRSIARIYTVMRERELGISYVPQPVADRTPAPAPQTEAIETADQSADESSETA